MRTGQQRIVVLALAQLHVVFIHLSFAQAKHNVNKNSIHKSFFDNQESKLL